jgi:hypothetical protein
MVTEAYFYSAGVRVGEPVLDSTADFQVRSMPALDLAGARLEFAKERRPDAKVLLFRGSCHPHSSALPE